MTAVTRAAEAPRAASSISSSSTRCSCTGAASGWIRNTSRSRQLDWSWTSRQSLANRRTVEGCSGTPRWPQISCARSGWPVPLKTEISRTCSGKSHRSSAAPWSRPSAGQPGGYQPGGARQSDQDRGQNDTPPSRNLGHGRAPIHPVTPDESPDPSGGGPVPSTDRRAEGRQVELGPDLMLNVPGARRGIDGEHVLLAAEDGQHGVGFLVVLAEPDRQCLLSVVLPRHQGRAAHVTAPGLARAAGDQVVVHAAARAEPPGQHAPADLAVGEVEVDHPVDVVALEEELGLALVTREPVDDEAVVPVVLAQPLPDHALDEVVADQQAGRHRAPDLGAELGVVLHVPAEDVADGDMDEVEVGCQHPRLGPLAAALDPHDDVFAHQARLSAPGYRPAERPNRRSHRRDSPVPSDLEISGQSWRSSAALTNLAMSLRLPRASSSPYRLRRPRSSPTSHSRIPGQDRFLGSRITPPAGPRRSSIRPGSRPAGPSRPGSRCARAMGPIITEPLTTLCSDSVP